MSISMQASKINKKPTKALAIDILKDLYDADGLNSSQKTDISILYSYFLPRTAKAKTDLSWLQKSVAKTDDRAVLKAVYSDGENLIGLNGNTMHIVNGLNKDQGFYNPIGDRVQDLGTFPDYKRLLDAVKVFQTSKLEEAETESLPDGKFIYKFKNGARVYKKQVDEALDKNAEAIIKLQDNDKAPILIEYDNRCALLMPLLR